MLHILSAYIVFRNVTHSLAKCSKNPLRGCLGSFWERYAEDPGPGLGREDRGRIEVVVARSLQSVLEMVVCSVWCVVCGVVACEFRHAHVPLVFPVT